MPTMLFKRAAQDAARPCDDRGDAVRLSRRAATEAFHDAGNLHATRQGQAEARERLVRWGANEVARERAPHPLRQFLACPANPFIAALVVLAAISYAADPEDLKPVVGSIMVTVSVALRFWQDASGRNAAPTAPPSGCGA